MRSYSLVAAVLLAASIAVLPANAQEPGDPVTFTHADEIYTGVLDPDLDTVSLGVISTVLAVPTTTVVVPVATTTSAAVGGAALGGGGGALTTQTGLQVISGYNPPAATVAPSPTNQVSGTILSASQIPGYTGQENTDGVTSGSAKVLASQVALGLFGGAVVFALL